MNDIESQPASLDDVEPTADLFAEELDDRINARPPVGLSSIGTISTTPPCTLASVCTVV